MAVSFPLTLPITKRPASASFRARSSVGVSSSPFTFQQQVQAHQGQIWEATLGYPIMKRPTAEEYASFLTKLNGREGTFTMGDPNGATPRGSADTAPGTPLVNGASQVGDTLVCDGAPNGVTGYLLEGDYVQLGTTGTSRLYKVLDDVNSDGSGNFTLNIWPDLRTSPANDEVLVVENAVSVFRLASNTSIWDLQPGVFYTISFTALEAL